jgi:hypothetical protein
MKKLYLVDVEELKGDIRMYMQSCLNPNEDKLISIVDEHTFITASDL